MIELKKGDITQMDVDAVVNAANSSLMGGGGVDGAIHKAGGPEILEACKKYRDKNGKLATGDAIITTAGNMPARYVIHTVGPVWEGGKNNEAELLANAYKNSLKKAADYALQSIAFPNISTGVYGFPKEAAAKIAIQAAEDFINAGDHSLEKVYFVCFDDENHEIYNNLLNA